MFRVEQDDAKIVSCSVVIYNAVSQRLMTSRAYDKQTRPRCGKFFYLNDRSTTDLPHKQRTYCDRTWTQASQTLLYAEWTAASGDDVICHFTDAAIKPASTRYLLWMTAKQQQQQQNWQQQTKHNDAGWLQACRRLLLLLLLCGRHHVPLPMTSTL